MTIVRDFLHWLDTAPTNERAETAGALGRAYLCSDLTADELAPAEGLMLKLLDDPSPLVRRALADALAASPAAPPAVIIALVTDQPQIAAPIYALSPLLIDADLVDGVATGGEAVQAAIASRAALPAAAAAALATRQCRGLSDFGGKSGRRNHAIIDRPDRRPVRRCGGDSRCAFGARRSCRDDQAKPGAAPVANARRLCRRPLLAGGGSRQAYRPRGFEKATVTIAGDSPKAELRPLIRHLCASGQLTAGLVLRALLSGNVGLFEEALAELGGMPLGRVSRSFTTASGPACGLCSKRRSCRRQCTRRSRRRSKRCAMVSLRAAMTLAYNAAWSSGFSPLAKVPMRSDLAPLITLLRRFATEAAREEARQFCEEIAAEPPRLIYSAAAWANTPSS